MKKIVGIVVCFVLCLFTCGGVLYGCGKKADVVIVSSMEDFRTDKLRQMLKEKFPELKIDVNYMPSGTNAAKVKAEKTAVEADIVMDIDYGYMSDLKDNFADLRQVTDTSVFLDEMVDSDSKFIPLSKFSIGVIVNESKLDGAPVPESYNDLLKSDYKGKIIMPNPKASGTGYGFLKGMVALKGEDAAFAYFEELQKNIHNFTSSGSGPVSSLVRGDSAIGIGMIFNAANENNKGANLKITNFAEGTPYNLAGMAMIKGRETNEATKKVFDFVAQEFVKYDKIHYIPEKIYKEQPPTQIENYPETVNFDMKGFSSAEKERLLGKWKY